VLVEGEWLISFPYRFNPRKKTPVPFEYEADWNPESGLLFWRREQFFVCTWIRTLDFHPVVDNFIIYNRIEYR
jgi:hypothetical protein